MNATLIIVLTSVFLLLAFLVLVWILTYRFNRRYRKTIFTSENSIRTVIVDKANRVVKFFNQNRVRNVRTVTLDQFNTQFSNEDVKRLDDWFNQLFRKNSKVEPYIEVEVYMNNQRRKCLSVFKATYINKEKKILHFDSYLFKRFQSRMRFEPKLTDLTIEEAVKRIKTLPRLKGYTVNFKFSCLNDSNTRVELDHLLYTHLKDIAFNYAKPPNRYVVESGGHDFSILDLRSNDEASIQTYIRNLVNEMKKFLEIKGELYRTTISVGVIANLNFPSNAQKLISKAKEMSNIALEKNTLIISYDENAADNVSYSSEIERVIKEHKLNYTFSPIYNVYKEKVLGYFSHVTPINANVKTLKELYTHSSKNEDNIKLLSALTKDVVNTYYYLNNDKNLVLFRNYKYEHIDLAINLLKSKAAKALKIALCFDEYDISYSASKNKDFFLQINKLKEKGIRPALKLSDKSLVLDPKIYASFDYFVVYNLHSDDKRNVNLSYRAIVEKLLKYNRPIILNKVIGWNEVELMVRSGVEYIASDTIASTSKILTYPNSKNIDKIRRMLD